MTELLLEGAQRTSHIYIAPGLLKQAAHMAMEQLHPARVCIVTDTNVAPLYLKELEQSFQQEGAQVSHHIIPAGEEHKTLATVANIYNTLCEQGFTRSDLLVALGGGVVGDITGFAASSFLRGVQLIQIPTTLLAQVDSSVGGKCGVDLPQGKNLVGAFNQPALVFIDPQVLDTLPQSTYSDGMAEVIKYSCIWDTRILDWVQAPDARENICGIVSRCVEIKRDVVQQDEQDNGLRMILNFGHTVGHGAEKLGNYTELTHGQGVAIGMVAAVKMGQVAGITKGDVLPYLMQALERYNLPTQLPYPVDEVYTAMMSDKKKRGGSINFIFVEQMGHVQVEKLPMEQLHDLMHKALEG